MLDQCQMAGEGHIHPQSHRCTQKKRKENAVRLNCQIMTLTLNIQADSYFSKKKKEQISCQWRSHITRTKGLPNPQTHSSVATEITV